MLLPDLVGAVRAGGVDGRDQGRQILRDDVPCRRIDTLEARLADRAQDHVARLGCQA